MKALFALFALTLAPTSLLADTITKDEIFSEKKYIGAIECGRVTSTGEYISHITGSASEKGLIGSKKIVSAFCAQGGGDCACYVPYLQEKPYSEKEHSYQVMTPDNTSLWITIPTTLKDTKTMLKLASQATGAELLLRNPAPAMFSNRSNTDTVSPEELAAVDPEGKNRKLVYTVKETETIAGVTTVMLSVDSVSNDSCGADKEKNMIHIWDIWANAYDNKGRVTFWLKQPDPC